MKIMFVDMKIKILTSVMIGRKIAIGAMLKHYNDNNIVVTSHLLN